MEPIFKYNMGEGVEEIGDEDWAITCSDSGWILDLMVDDVVSGDWGFSLGDLSDLLFGEVGTHPEGKIFSDLLLGLGELVQKGVVTVDHDVIPEAGSVVVSRS